MENRENIEERRNTRYPIGERWLETLGTTQTDIKGERGGGGGGGGGGKEKGRTEVPIGLKLAATPSQKISQWCV